mgnify:CR=1 FL=1
MSRSFKYFWRLGNPDARVALLFSTFSMNPANGMAGLTSMRLDLNDHFCFCQLCCQMDSIRKHNGHRKMKLSWLKHIEKILLKGVPIMSEFNDFFNEQLKDSDLAKEWENMQPEFDVIRAIVEARTSQNLTQKELLKRIGINQADISKLENGTRNPSLKVLKRLADGMGMNLKIVFVPKNAANN